MVYAGRLLPKSTELYWFILTKHIICCREIWTEASFSYIAYTLWCLLSDKPFGDIRGTRMPFQLMHAKISSLAETCWQPTAHFKQWVCAAWLQSQKHILFNQTEWRPELTNALSIAALQQPHTFWGISAGQPQPHEYLKAKQTQVSRWIFWGPENTFFTGIQQNKTLGSNSGLGYIAKCLLITITEIPEGTYNWIKGCLYLHT